MLDYPYADELAAAEKADRIAWVRNPGGARNVWIAEGPSYKPLQVTHYTADDSQEITQLTFSPDGTRLVYVRGGDHDENWPAEGNLAPDPSSVCYSFVTADAEVLVATSSDTENSTITSARRKNRVLATVAWKSRSMSPVGA